LCPANSPLETGGKCESRAIHPKQMKNSGRPGAAMSRGFHGPVEMLYGHRESWVVGLVARGASFVTDPSVQ